MGMAEEHDMKCLNEIKDTKLLIIKLSQGKPFLKN